MLSFVLALAILNLLLGYAAAMALAEPPLWAGLRPAWPRRPRPSAADGLPSGAASESTPLERPTAASVELAKEAIAQPIVAGLDELPGDWLAQLATHGIVAQSFTEATAHILRLEIGAYREQLVVAEVRVRQVVASADVYALRQLCDQLRSLNQDWLDRQTTAADMLGQRAGRLGDHEQAAASLEQVLLDQAVQIRNACSVLESVDADKEIENHGKCLLEQVTILLVQAHALRDRVLDLLATLMLAGQNVAACPAAVQRDIITGLPNRIGLDALLAGWWQADEQRTRLLSAILVDLDRFGRVNQRIGVRAGDRTLLAISRLIDETLAKDRGFERLVRVSGQSFLILLGDVGPHQALTTAERLRQSLEATTFDEQAVEFDVTVSCGVIEVGHTESSLELARRCEAAVRFAKKAGRNRCAIDKGEGPAMIEPPQFPVKGRVIALGEIELPTTMPAIGA